MFITQLKPYVGSQTVANTTGARRSSQLPSFGASASTQFQHPNDSVHFGTKNKNGDTVDYKEANSDWLGYSAILINIHGKLEKYHVLKEMSYPILNQPPYPRTPIYAVHQIVQENNPLITGVIYKKIGADKWERLEIRDPNDRMPTDSAANAVDDEAYDEPLHNDDIEFEPPHILELQLNRH